MIYSDPEICNLKKYIVKSSNVLLNQCTSESHLMTSICHTARISVLEICYIIRVEAWSRDMTN